MSNPSPNHNLQDDPRSDSKRPIPLGALLSLLIASVFVVGAIAVVADSRREIERLERNNELLRTQNSQLERANMILSEQVRQYGGEPITDWGG